MNARQMVTTVGWIWVGFGALAFMSATGGFLMSLVMGDRPEPPAMDSFSVNFLFKHYRTAAAVQIFFALFVMLAGYYFTQRRNWARIAIQIISLLIILWFVFFGIAWVRISGSMKAAPDGPSEGLVQVIKFVMSAGGLVISLVFAALFGSCIWLLGREKVRGEFRRIDQGRQE